MNMRREVRASGALVGYVERIGSEWYSMDREEGLINEHASPASAQNAVIDAWLARK